MKYLAFLFALLQPVLGLPASGSATDRLHLVRIMVTGSKRYSQEDLVRASGLAVNTEVTQDDLQNAANHLGTSGAFATVQFLFKPATGIRGVEADFAVVDAAQFLPASFDNFPWFSDSELQALVHQAVPLFSGAISTGGTMADDVKAALANILSTRKLPSDVSYTLAAEMGHAPSACRFRVENAGLKVNAFHFSGATRVPLESLTRTLAFLLDQEYSRSVIEQALTSNLLPLYLERGYLKFKVEGFQPALEGNGVVVNVQVVEGGQYTLAGYRWVGNTLIPPEELSQLLTAKVGEPVNVSRLEADLGKVRKAYGKFGREDATVKPVPEFSANANSVHYNLEVTEGDLFRMGRVEISGIDGDTARKLMKSWKLAEGQPYDNTYYRQFIAEIAMATPGSHWEWVAVEKIDPESKRVNVALRLKTR